MINFKKIKIGVLGLGYVGLPLAVEFSKKFRTFGFDTNTIRVKQLKNGKDETREVLKKDLIKANKLIFTNNYLDLSACNVYIVTVPTPILKNKKTNLKFIKEAYKFVSKMLKIGDTVILESTVYPGTTKEICVPILEKYSGLKFNKHFYRGYSPERINPGDKKHTISRIKKITSGSNEKASKLIDGLYKHIISAGTYLAENIEIAEAAKVIENTQRDLNIALINEFSIIFNKMGIETMSVLKAAKTKWNFLPFEPGLVGGHCIGVDPYYLTHKAQIIGYDPKIILSGRKLNDSMGAYVVKNLKKLLKQNKKKLPNVKILIMGLSFKENCKDIRNTKVLDIYNGLKHITKQVDLFDPIVSKSEVKKVFGIFPTQNLYKNKYDAIILSVPHLSIKKMGIKEIRNLCKTKGIIYDIKSVFNIKYTDLRL